MPTPTAPSTNRASSPSRNEPKPLTCHLLRCRADDGSLGPDRGANVKDGWRGLEARLERQAPRAAIRAAIRTAPDRGSALDDDPAQAVLARQAVGLGLAVARPDERPVGFEELRVPRLVGSGVGVRGGHAALAQLEDVADGEPCAVAERLAVHDEGIREDPADGHRTLSRRPCR